MASISFAFARGQTAQECSGVRATPLLYSFKYVWQPIFFNSLHDDVIKWKHFPRYWPFVQDIHRSPVNSPQRPVTRSFDAFFDLRLNKQLSKQPWGWWFETPSGSLWRHCNVNILIIAPRAPTARQPLHLKCSSNIILRCLYSDAMLITCSPYFKNCLLWSRRSKMHNISLICIHFQPPCETPIKNSFSKFCSCSSVSATIIRSSAYNKEFMCTLSRSSVGPYYFKCIAKSLKYKLNNVGDKYPPWRTPQTFSNHCERSGTFSSMHDMVFVRRVFTDLYILPSRLWLNNLYKRSLLLTQWNAFSISWMHSMLLCFQWYYFW